MKITNKKRANEEEVSYCGNDFLRGNLLAGGSSVDSDKAGQDSKDVTV